MARKARLGTKYPPNSIRAWREQRNLTLEKLASRVQERHPITAASLSRIERSQQPWSQPILEALAWALQCEPPDLIRRAPPSKDQIELWTVIRGLDATQQRQAVRLVKALASEAA